jgi:predicted O-linked N-acetylglucosamine transferase (SPINDLY family)
MNRKQRRAAGKAGPPDALAAAVRHHQAGRLPEAEAAYRQVLAAQPANADALHGLGVMAAQVGRFDLATDLIGRAIRHNARNPAFFTDLGAALHEQNRLDEAAAAYRSAIAHRPNQPEPHVDLGNILLTQGKPAEAEAAYRQSIRIRPTEATSHANLGVALQRQGKLAEAVSAYRRAAELNPDYAEAQANLGGALLAQGERDAAAEAYRRALALRPGYPEAHSYLGVALLELGRLDQSIAAHRQAVALAPDNAELQSNFGSALLAQGRPQEAEAAFQRAIAVRPDHAVAHGNLGNALRDQGRLDAAVSAYHRAIALWPDHAVAHANLGNALQDMGRLDAAMAAFRRAIAINPAYAAAHSNLLMCMNYAASVSNADLHAEAQHFARRFDPAVSPAVHANTRDPVKRLRIGYVSADFRNHPIGYFLARVLAAHDPADVEITCYANQATDDAMTERLRASAHRWRSILGLSDADAASLIRQDGIDILVDLAGHSANNRLALFARRPAPVQATWIGYFATTGLSCMDYVLADRFVVPEQDEQFYTETVCRLPGIYLCHRPHDIDVTPAPPPATANGFVTFGCFNNRAKITADTLRVWAAVLQTVPGARLFLKNRSLGDAAVAQALAAAFTTHGVAADRLILEGQSPLPEWLAAYRRVDIALDPFPFGGGTTTAESLWMGVPVVTLRGERWVGRISQAMLATVGLADLVAADGDGYVRIAAALAADAPRLAALHADLRRMVETSALCDGPRFADGLEAAYRRMWQAWCAAPA